MRRAAICAVKLHLLPGRGDLGGHVTAVFGGECAVILARVVVKGEEVVVNVATGECWGLESVDAVFLPSTQAGDGHEADRLHITSALNTVSKLIILVVVTDMGVAAKELDGSVPVRITNSLVDSIELARLRHGHMTRDDEEIDVLVPDGFLEPLLLDCLLNRLDDGVVRIAGKVE